MAPIALTPPGLEEPSPEPATGAHGTAPPMPLPQGLAEAVRGELAAAARDAAAERLEELGPILGPAREAVLRDVDLRVDERVGELWTKAKQMFGAMQQKHSSQSKALVEEVTRCQANCEALEAENVQLKQVGALTPMQTPSSTTPPGLGLAMPLMQGKDGFGLVPGTGHFNFTLRKANGADLGLNVITIEHQRVLRVESVRAGGAVDAWNRQCAGGSCADKVVHPGDLVINVNGVSFDPPKMLQECRDKQLLRLTILRRDPILCGPPLVPMPAKAKGSPPQRTAAAAAAALAAAAGLRADASVFVPTPN
mmetsp:Transcript_20488/g.66279  ORF Transcript_20488/g.66279 Transcript_20488/m.66279 type:complete len:309 (+) Transcript_20488:106-1032(+)